MIICVIAIAFASLICYASCVVSADADRRAEQMYERWRKEQKMSDLIKREDAIKAVWSPQVRPNALIFDALKRAIESLINNIPSADRPQWEWVEHERAEEVNGMLISNYECSYCHEWERKASAYCPNCGARMIRQLDAKIVVNGNCALCGKPLSDGRLFVCKECEEHIEKGADDE